MSRNNQRGYYMVGPTGAELIGCLAFVVIALVGAGVVLALLAPVVWTWIKPWLQALVV